MADEERDPRVSQRYRELAREEPPREVDAAILAAARGAVATHPAPLVVPTGRRRWYFPLAAAAIIILAVAVTVQVERQQPDPELAVPPVTAPKVPTDEQTVPAERAAEEVKPAAKPAPARKAAPMFAPDPKPEASGVPSRELRAQRDAAPAESQAAPAPAPAPASPPAAAPPRGPDAAAQAPAPPGAASEIRESRRMDAAAERQRAAAQRAPAPAARPMATLAAEPPEQWLERIAELRKREKHEEADKQLQEFRKRYPDYRIPAAMLEKVEKK